MTVSISTSRTDLSNIRARLAAATPRLRNGDIPEQGLDPEQAKNIESVAKLVSAWTSASNSGTVLNPAARYPTSTISDVNAMFGEYGVQIDGQEPTQFFAAWVKDGMPSSGALAIVAALNSCPSKILAPASGD
jgi:hypothetical protein